MTNRYIRPQEPPQDVEELVGVDGSGYSGLDPGKMLGQPVTAQGVDRLRADQSAAEQAGTARTLDDYEIAQLNELQHQAAAHGVRLFLLAHPTASPETFGEFSAVSRAEREGRLDMPLTSFADPVTYFDLYRPGGFTDPDHIDRIVAGQVSVKAADAFVAEMKSSKKGDTGAVH
jgi:hypothetical protein